MPYAATVFLAVALAAAAAGGQGSRPDAAKASSPAASAPAPASPGVSRRTPLENLGVSPSLELRGNAGTASFSFGTRADELVTRATLHLRYAWSPSAAPSISHIRVSVNDDVVGVLPVTAEDAGKPATRDLDIDPRLITGNNKVVMDFVGAKGAGDEDPQRPGLWAEVSGASELEVVVQPLALADDLALLPEPFFDKRDQRRVTVPFVFSQQPSPATLRSAAVVASWLGKLASWRGARFSAILGDPPPGHAIVFATNDERPASLSLAQASGPEIRLMTNPADGRSKLLVLLGRDANDLKAAADALVLATSAFSGATLQVKRVAERAPRAAYDAPRWVRVERPVKLGELIDWAQQLEATGRPPALDPVGVAVRMPPDLVTWRGPGVPMQLKFQYTPPACAADGHLDVTINGEQLQEIALRAGTEGAGGGANAAPQSITDERDLVIPAYRLRPRNQLKFAFRFAMRDDGGCRNARSDVVKAAVLPDSTLDFSGFPHYAQMPNLASFASVGFPFTRYADLSQTIVVVPDKPAAPDVEVLLTLAGRMGESTGEPATGVRVVGEAEASKLVDADLIVIGASPQLSLLDKWNEGLPAILQGKARRVSAGSGRSEAVFEGLAFGEATEAALAQQVSLEGDGPLTAILGFESPVTPGRTVVAITASKPGELPRALDALEGSDSRRAIRGGAAFIRAGKVESALPARAYAIGEIPAWTGAWYRITSRPMLAGAVVGGVLLALAAFGWGVGRGLGRFRRKGRG